MECNVINFFFFFMGGKTSLLSLNDNYRDIYK